MRDQDLVLEAFKSSGTLIVTPDKIYDLSVETDEQYAELKTFISRQEYKAITKRLHTSSCGEIPTWPARKILEEMSLNVSGTERDTSAERKRLDAVRKESPPRRRRKTACMSFRKRVLTRKRNFGSG